MLKKTDIDTWNQYISNLYSLPEEQFKTPKARDSEPYTLDLHGMTIQQAFNRTNQYLERHYSAGTRYVTIITGKDGKINDEFTHWCSNYMFISKCEPLIDTRGECGAYIIWFKRPKIQKNS